MRLIKLAVVFDQPISAGGGYQQAVNTILHLNELAADVAEPLFFTTLHENILQLHSHGIRVELIRLSPFSKLLMYVRRKLISPRLLRFIKYFQLYNPFERIFINNKIDLVYFLSPTEWAYDLETLNYVTTVWDLSQRDDPEFPEVRCYREFERREFKFRSILPKAVAVIVDSSLGKENVIRRYGVDEKRVYISPFQGAIATRTAGNCQQNSQSVALKYGLDCQYVYYPAQFWPHKNHVYLLEGLKALEEFYSKRVGAIFTGLDKGNRDYIEKYATNLGLAERVKFIGFVTNEEVVPLYQESLALVMPTYFGPTNLPPLEAFSLGVPVLYPNLEGLRDQVGCAALLMDLKDPQSMAYQLSRLLDEPGLREQLASEGFSQLEKINSVNRGFILKDIIDEYKWRRNCWE